MIRFAFALLIFIAITNSSKAQGIKLPFIENGNDFSSLSNYFRILEVERSKGNCKVKFLITYTGHVGRKFQFGKIGSLNEFYIIDRETGKRYNSRLQNNLEINVKQYKPRSFEIIFEPLPNTTKVIDINQGGCKSDDVCFKGVHLEHNFERSTQDNLELFNKYTSQIIDKKALSEFRERTYQPNIVTMPQGWQYEVLKKGNGKCINLSNFDKYKYSFAKIKQSERWHDYKKGSWIPVFNENNWEIGEANSFTGLKGYRYTLEDALLLMDEGAVWKLYIPGVPYSSNRETGRFDQTIIEINLSKHVQDNSNSIQSPTVVKKVPAQKKGVVIEDLETFVTKGDGATFAQLLTYDEDVSFQNQNVFVIGKIVNYTNQIKKVKIDVTYNIIHSTTSIIGGGNSDEKHKIVSVYHELKPNSFVPLITYIKFTEYRRQFTFLASHTIKLKEGRPYDIEIKDFNGTIPTEQIKFQNELLEQIKTNGNIPIIEGWDRELAALKNDYQRKANANETKQFFFIDEKNKKSRKYSCKGIEYTYYIYPVKCNCFNTDNYNIYYWSGSCGYKEGYYNSEEWSLDSFLGKNKENLINTLKRKCGCN